jgi:membrane-associated phospholipid phosphatase
MIGRRRYSRALTPRVIFALSLAATFPAPAQNAVPPGIDAKSVVRAWNRAAVDASGLDHSAPIPGEDRAFQEQMGPGRASRAMAIVHIAMFDAVNAIAGGYHSYTGVPSAPYNTSMAAAVAQAAHDTLVALFPAQKTSFARRLAEEMRRIPASSSRERGRELGRRAAAAILALRADDGSAHAEPVIGIDYLMTDAMGEWRQDPISQVPMALGGYWMKVRPFVMESAEQFRVPPPPSPSTPEWAVAFDEARRLGGDGVITPTERTDDQTEAGIFWAYDGTPSLCAPPRLYNQIAVQIADQMGASTVEFARLLALVNVAMADAGIAIWESKYYYKFCRPVTGIREADRDGNPATTADPTFTPLGAPASNLNGPNFTPPFPAYPSGHAGFGGALFQTLRTFYGTDAIPFVFVSDEYNGVTRDNQGNVRPLRPRHFASLSEAEEENGQSRIYLGIHWSFDKTEGIIQGRKIADYVFQNAFSPLAPAAGAR